MGPHMLGLALGGSGIARSPSRLQIARRLHMLGLALGGRGISRSARRCAQIGRRPHMLGSALGGSGIARSALRLAAIVLCLCLRCKTCATNRGRSNQLDAADTTSCCPRSIA